MVTFIPSTKIGISIKVDTGGSGVSVSYEPRSSTNVLHYRQYNYPGDGTARWLSRADAITFAGEDNIIAAELAVFRLAEKREQLRKIGRQEPAYKTMEKLAEGFLTAYITDLTNHDALTIAENPDAYLFFWAVRPSGTRLYTSKNDRIVRLGKQDDERFYIIYPNGTYVKMTHEDWKGA